MKQPNTPEEWSAFMARLELQDALAIQGALDAGRAPVLAGIPDALTDVAVWMGDPPRSWIATIPEPDAAVEGFSRALGPYAFRVVRTKR